MNDNPFFSIVIPTFNCAELLKRALKSVFSQTFQDFEIIVIDNSSTDNTQNILKRFFDKRLNIIMVKNDGIIAYSRNRGIEKAKGKWIAFLDSDDVWKAEKLEKVKNAIDKNQEAILFCHDELHVENGEIKSRLKYGPADLNMYEKLLFKGNCLSTSAVCVRRDIAQYSGRFSERKDFITVEDYEYWIRLAKVGDFYFINEVLGEWHTHGGNESENSLLHANALVNVMNHHFNIYKENNNILTRIFYKGRSNYFSVAANILRKGKYYDEAKIFSKEGLVNDPLSWKNWAILLLSYIIKRF